ncbi:MAG: hypothetical protein ACN6QH_18065 [Pseudomonas sp.]|uniref:hypothetical protein n=1 Tax=Pseudomonas sp. TaxID=306 RepID=UPI003D151E58
MNSTEYSYGEKVVEFFKHDEAELSQLIKLKVARYNANAQGLFFKDPAANIEWVCKKPLHLALLDLQEEWRKGYTLVNARYDTLDFKAQLRKPDKVIKSELRTLTDETRADYNKLRYERNAAETARQVSITLSIKRRREEKALAASKVETAEAETAAAAAAALAKIQQDLLDEEAALADLVSAYSQSPGAS